MYLYTWITGAICLVILHIFHGISWAVATSSIEKAVIDVFHDLFVEKQWHGFRTSIRSLGNKIIFILLSISSMYRISTCCIHTCTWYKNTINSTCIKKTLSKNTISCPYGQLIYIIFVTGSSLFIS